MRASSIVNLALSTLALAAVASLSACDEVSPPDAADDDVSARTGTGYGCTFCSLNSPTVNDSVISELNLDGQPSSTSVKLLNIKNPQNNAVYRPDIDLVTDRLIARDMITNSAVFSGPQLVGKVLSLQTPDGPLALKITGYDDAIPSWSTTGAPITIYRMEYTVGGVTFPICPNGAGDNKQLVTLIGGELYDRTTNEIVPGMARWFTLACVAEAAYKMKLMDYHPAGNRKATLDQRRTTLRMITADYCGDGTPYTVDGTTVAWRNSSSTVVPTVAEIDLEAKWGPIGASCLDTPRYYAKSDVHCSLPACNGDAQFGGAEWRTMTP